MNFSKLCVTLIIFFCNHGARRHIFFLYYYFNKLGVPGRELDRVGIRKVRGFVPQFRAGNAHVVGFCLFLKASSSDDLVGHDKDGHGNMDIDFSGCFHIY